MQTSTASSAVEQTTAVTVVLSFHGGAPPKPAAAAGRPLLPPPDSAAETAAAKAAEAGGWRNASPSRMAHRRRKLAQHSPWLPGDGYTRKAGTTEQTRVNAGVGSHEQVYSGTAR